MKGTGRVVSPSVNKADSALPCYRGSPHGLTPGIWVPEPLTWLVTSYLGLGGRAWICWMALCVLVCTGTARRLGRACRDQEVWVRPGAAFPPGSLQSLGRCSRPARQGPRSPPALGSLLNWAPKECGTARHRAWFQLCHSRELEPT